MPDCLMNDKRVCALRRGNDCKKQSAHRLFARFACLPVGNPSPAIPASSQDT